MLFRSLGFEFEEMTASLMVLANAGIKGSLAGTSLRRIFLRMAAPTTAARKLLKELNIEIFNLSPVAKTLENKILGDARALERLEQQMKEASAASDILRDKLNLLALDEAENNLKIMRIRDEASDQRRDLTEAEEAQIALLQDANRDLSISEQELRIEEQKLQIQQNKTKKQTEELKESIVETTKEFDSQKGEMKPLIDIVSQFESALGNLSDEQREIGRASCRERV